MPCLPGRETTEKSHEQTEKDLAPMTASERLPLLLKEVRACTICAAHLPHGPRPVLQADARARILIAGQAPGSKVHAGGVPFDDASGERLRQWMGIERDQFYDPTLVAILPMGFCYPGTGRSGDLPPRPECAPQWRARLLKALPRIELTLVIGQYAMAWHLPGAATRNLTETVHAWREHGPAVLPLPHPSPRNNIWLKANPWFALDVVPVVQARIRSIIAKA
jgi:uracil-DNA glycosylase